MSYSKRLTAPCRECGKEIARTSPRGPIKLVCDDCIETERQNRIASRPPPKRAGMMFLLGHVSYKGEECLRWPMGTNRGYGQVCIGGATVRKAHRVMCELAHGSPPTQKHEAAHICGNHFCVNPRHLAWKTRKENQLDSVRMGRMYRGGRGGKLNRKNADRIKRLKGKLSQDQIAKMFDVTHSTVAKIHRGELWK